MEPIVVLQILVVSLAIHEAPVRSFLLHESKCQVQPRVSTCETCTGKGKNALCRNKDNFGFGKYCFRENIHNASGLFFTKGVATPDVCQQKMHLSSAVQQECKKALPAIGTVCYDCCFQSSCSLDENYCNNLEPIPTAYMPYHSSTTQTPKPTPKPTPSPTTSKPTTHTTRPTTRPTTQPTTKPTTQSTTKQPTTRPTTKPTTQPTTTPTTQPTTTPTTQPTTSPTTRPTTQPTTHSVVTSSTAPAGRLCQVCVEQDGTKCTENDYQTCDVSQTYCMNTLITDSSQYIVKKKCASEVDCRWDYWIGTRSDSRCNTTTGFATEIDLCHYCCQTNDGSTSPCNKAQLPTKLASFDIPSTTQKKCIVGDTIFGFHEDVCESEEMYCLNTVRYKKDQVHPVEQVRKGCALEAECRGQWWFKTRNQPECLSLQFNNLTHDEILCHYCCISNDTDSCNGPNIPHQLYSFLPPTASPPLPNDRTTNIPTKLHVSTTTPKQTTSTTTTPATTSTTTTPTTVSTTATLITTTPTTISTTTTPATTVKVTVPPPKTTPAITELPCNGSSSLECKDDPLVDCKFRDKLQGLCRNPNDLVIDHCPLTCGLCNQYCANQIAKLTTAPPTTTTTAAPIVTPCQGSTAVVCKDDPMVDCQLKNVNEGLCQSSNALVTDHCPLTCGKCDQYCVKQIAKLTTAPPTTTTTAAPIEIPCQGSTTVVCKDDPMVDCQSKNVNEGLCQVSNQLVTDHCPVTCGKCDQYCAKNVPAGQSTRTSMTVTLQSSTSTAGNASQSSSSTSTAGTISRSTTISTSKTTRSTTDITTSTAISSAYAVNPTTKTNQQTTTISHAQSSSSTLTDTTTGQQTITTAASATTASATTATTTATSTTSAITTSPTTTSPTTATSPKSSASTTSPTTATSTTSSATTTSPTTTASPTTTKTTKSASSGFTATSSTASRVTTSTVNPVSMTWVTVPNARPASTTETLASCYVCSGPDFLCESFYHLQTCPSDKQFCMNRVTNNMDGSRTMTRSCATESQCRTEWWQGSSSKNECMGYDASGITLSQFGCAFCCTTSGCNKNVIPSDLYIGSK